MDFNFIQIWHDLAVNSYNVDPAVFIFLMLISIPPYYYGWYALAREAIDFRKRYKVKNNYLKVTDILSEKNFLLPLAINRSAWIAPYLYVIFWGQNIPPWFWILFLGWIGLSSYLFWNKLKEKITSAK
ncbi:MAG: hypothetical protein PHT36_02365 [Patescibacteria group bacterium]|nr:hypothetical protein [Patescibacteria group bacterium]